MIRYPIPDEWPDWAEPIEDEERLPPGMAILIAGALSVALWVGLI